jgi:hypothetical protein
MTGYGLVTIAGRTYAEREQTFPLIVPVTADNQVINGILALPGEADFWLKALTRDVLVSGASSAKRFSFRLGNTDGNTWYQSGGVGGTTDRVIDTLLFGTAQFPKVLNPYVYYTASAGLLYQVEDLTGGATSAPYTIYFGFVGSYLYPTQ